MTYKEWEKTVEYRGFQKFQIAEKKILERAPKYFFTKKDKCLLGLEFLCHSYLDPRMAQMTQGPVTEMCKLVLYRIYLYEEEKKKTLFGRIKAFLKRKELKNVLNV